MPKPWLHLLLWLPVSAFAAANPADVLRDLRTPLLGKPATVSNVAINIGHLKLTLASGSAAKLAAAGETVGLFFQGTGSFEYVAEATELPLVARNVKSDSKAKLSGAAIRDEVA